MGAVVRVFDVKAQADDIDLRTGDAVDVAIEGAEDTLAAEGFSDVNALKPPDPAVAPVAPLTSDRGLAGEVRRAAGEGDPVADSVGVGNRLGDTESENVGVERFGFGFEREQAIELDDGGQIALKGRAD